MTLSTAARRSPVAGTDATPTDEPPAPPTGEPSDEPPEEPPDEPSGLDHRVREVPRLGRLVTAIGRLRPEVHDWVPADEDGERRRARAETLLRLAQGCADDGRVDDGWAYLNAADRASLARLDDEVLQVMAECLRLECAAKLTGWRAAAAVSSLDGVGGDGASLLPRVAAARELLDDDAQNTYLRLRLLGRRVAVATTLLAVVLAVLTALVLLGWGAEGADRPAFLDEGVLGDPGWFAQVCLLGALGAMLSAAITAMDHGSAPRVYELSTPLVATAVARVLVGSAAAVVTVMAAEVELLPGMAGWLPVLAVVSGFSERLVRRVVATLSEAAEHTSPAPVPPSTSVTTTRR